MAFKDALERIHAIRKARRELQKLTAEHAEIAKNRW